MERSTEEPNFMDICSANDFGIRSAMLFPHFWIFTRIKTASKQSVSTLIIHDTGQKSRANSMKWAYLRLYMISNFAGIIIFYIE
jgi:hypothetical protein